MKFKVMTATFALALIAGLATLALAASPGPVSAASGGNVEATFTKWVTDADFPTFPWDMNGVVGGDVGIGTFTGEVLSKDALNGTIDQIHALYRVNGADHDFTADLKVTQNHRTNTAVLNGVITEGWLAGAQVHGEYTIMPTCPIPTPGNIFGTLCFQGTLRIMVGSAD